MVNLVCLEPNIGCYGNVMSHFSTLQLNRLGGKMAQQWDIAFEEWDCPMSKTLALLGFQNSLYDIQCFSVGDWSF